MYSNDFKWHVKYLKSSLTNEQGLLQTTLKSAEELYRA